jgi:hypothetical protein
MAAEAELQAPQSGLMIVAAKFKACRYRGAKQEVVEMLRELVEYNDTV